MPRTGYSSEDPVVKRSGYVSHDNNPVDRRGGPETHSGRINHARMNERASPGTFEPSLSPSFDPRSRHLYVARDKLFSTTASDLSTVRPRDDLHRNEPSQELERRSRGYNPGYYGERISSYGSSPQLDGLDRGYQGKFTSLPISECFSPNRTVGVKMRRPTGLAISHWVPTMRSTSDKRPEAIKRRINIDGTGKNGGNLEVQPLTYLHMYATLARVDSGSTNNTTS